MKRPFSEDLPIVARRRQPSSAESKALRELEADVVERALLRAGRAFDAQEAALPGDDELAASLALHALSQVAVPSKPLPASVSPIRGAVAGDSRRFGRSRGALLGIAVSFAAAAAAAGGYAVLKRQASSDPVTSTTLPSPPAGARVAGHQPAPKPGAGAGMTPNTIPEPSAAPSILPTPIPLSREATALSAEDLFSRANAERRAGRMRESLGAYEELLARFPGSSEAQVARVSLGNLLLTRGNAARALTLFDTHLSRGGALAEEALYGKARALHALGRTADEQKVWQTLKSRYPNSIYARAAQSPAAPAP